MKILAGPVMLPYSFTCKPDTLSGQLHCYLKLRYLLSICLFASTLAQAQFLGEFALHVNFGNTTPLYYYYSPDHVERFGYWNSVRELPKDVSVSGFLDYRRNSTEVSFRSDTYLPSVSGPNYPVPSIFQEYIASGGRFTLTIEGLDSGEYLVISYAAEIDPISIELRKNIVMTVTPYGDAEYSEFSKVQYLGYFEEGMTHTVSLVHVGEEPLTIDYSYPADAFLNGISIVQVPESSWTVTIISISAIGFYCKRRREIIGSP